MTSAGEHGCSGTSENTFFGPRGCQASNPIIDLDEIYYYPNVSFFCSSLSCVPLRSPCIHSYFSIPSPYWGHIFMTEAYILELQNEDFQQTIWFRPTAGIRKWKYVKCIAREREVRGERWEVRGERWEVRGERREARGERREARGERR